MPENPAHLTPEERKVAMIARLVAFPSLALVLWGIIAWKARKAYR